MEQLNLDSLRTFVSIVELNGFNKAAEKIHLSQSAISMQMKRLEEQTGHSLFERKGKQRILTHQGEVLLSHARKMLELNDELLLALGENKQKGKIRMGIQLDFAQSSLPGVVYRYIKYHPEVMLDLRVESSDVLQELLHKRKLDLAVYLAREKNSAFDAVVLGNHALEWLSSPSFSILPFKQSPVPLVVLGANCKIRQSISATLSEAGIPWRIAFASTSLSAAFGAVSAGIGISARTKIGMPNSLRVVPKSFKLPSLPSVQTYVCTSIGEKSRQVLHLKEFLLNEVKKSTWIL